MSQTTSPLIRDFLALGPWKNEQRERELSVFLAFLSAIACSLHIVESLITRALPLPFLRLGLSNVIILYLIVNNKAWQAIIVNITKTLVSAVVTFTFLSPVP